MKAAESAESATRLRRRLGTWKAITKAAIGPLVPKSAAATLSRTRPATRLTAVHPAKTAVLRPTTWSAALRPAGGASARVTTTGPPLASLLRYAAADTSGGAALGEHQAAEEAHSPSSGTAAREPALQVDDPDAVPPDRGGRVRGPRRRGPQPGAPDRPRGRARGDPPEQRRPQEGAPRADAGTPDGRHRGLAPTPPSRAPARAGRARRA